MMEDIGKLFDLVVAYEMESDREAKRDKRAEMMKLRAECVIRWPEKTRAVMRQAYVYCQHQKGVKDG